MKGRVQFPELLQVLFSLEQIAFQGQVEVDNTSESSDDMITITPPLTSSFLELFDQAFEYFFCLKDSRRNVNNSKSHHVKCLHLSESLYPYPRPIHDLIKNQENEEKGSLPTLVPPLFGPALLLACLHLGHLLQIRESVGRNGYLQDTLRVFRWFEEMPTGLYFAAMNYTVHAVMYFYYFLSGSLD